MDPTASPHPSENVKIARTPRPVTLVAFIAIAFLLIAVLSGRTFILRQYDALRLAAFSRRIADADQIVGTWKRTDVRLTFTGAEMKKIVQATSSAKSARMPDSAFTCMFDATATFYQGTNFLGEIHLCNGLFHLENGGRGTPPFYKDALDEIIYVPLLNAMRSWHDEQYELQKKQKLTLPRNS